MTVGTSSQPMSAPAGITVTVKLAVVAAPPLSPMVTVAVYVPAVEYKCDAQTLPVVTTPAEPGFTVHESGDGRRTVSPIDRSDERFLSAGDWVWKTGVRKRPCRHHE